MKKLMTLILAAGLFVAGTAPASAIEFKAQGEWLMGFGVGDGNLVNKVRSLDTGKKSKVDNSDKFSAMQRVRLQLDAVASENLSGTVLFELLETTWGNAESGGALGADGQIVGVLNAYIDWAVPNTDLKVRMGLQPIEMPNVAGGSSILNTDALAAVTLNYQFNENVGATLMWGRPYNDNYTSADTGYGNDKTNYLDNIDLIALSVPLTFDGIEVTPWIMYGIIGQNVGRRGWDADAHDWAEYAGPTDLFAFNGGIADRNFERKHANTSAFWAGLPFKLSFWDPLNIEVDLNYGYVESMGRGELFNNHSKTWKRADTRREGWLAKALIEYKMDWGTPGVFGWYASGDDSNVKNGSERLPAIEAKGNFTSIMGDDNYGWASNSTFYDRTLNYAGTWGVGLQLKDMSFVEDLSHTFRVAYWGGTNSPEMAKYAGDMLAWDNSGYAPNISDGLYLTRNDGLLEFNLINKYQMYENFEINLELGYMVNFFDHDTWKKAGGTYSSYEKQDAWKAQLIFAYSF